MTPDLTVLERSGHFGPEVDIDEDTIEPFDEGVWWAWRKSRFVTTGSLLNIRNGVWWTHDGSRILSYAEGPDLHMWPDCHETFPIEGNEGDDDCCCHTTRAEADACARHYMRTGRICGGRDD